MGDAGETPLAEVPQGIRDWFVVSGPVGRQRYVTVGLGLALFKYIVELVAIGSATGRFFSPLDFVNPWLSTKAPFLVDAPGAGVLWLLFTIPFVWVAITMSVRRAADVGASPWLGVLMLVPLVNLVAMLVLSVLPTGFFRLSPQQLEAEARERQALAEAYSASAITEPPEPVTPPPGFDRPNTWARVTAAVVVGCLTQTLVGMFSVWLLQVYGFVLFFTSPVIAGAVTGFIYGGGASRSLLKLLGCVVLMNILSFVGMLMLGLDGAVCLVMAFPLLGPLSVMGGILGSALAQARLRPGVDEKKGMIGTICLLPFCLFLEPFDQHAPLHAVTTSIDIAAAPEEVWEHVITFPEIDAPMAWYFRLGIAAPSHATIEGTGVGAVRRCEFTTGTFVEPITAWEAPERLAFDVTSQPMPMKEWTPFEHLHPPHLDTGFVSRKGEFYLERLPDGGTRLHGTTWYQIDVRPRLYWKTLADPILHAIHRRVLDHIARQTTEQGS